MLAFLLLLVGQISQSSSVIFIKASHMDPAVLSASRLFLAALLVFPLWVVERRKSLRLGSTHIAAEVSSISKPTKGRTVARRFVAYILPGLLLSLHFISWNAGARMTIASQATLVVNLVPLVMPVIIFILLREKPKKYHVIGSIVAIVGLFVLGASDLRFDSTAIAGDLVCLLSMLFLAFYLALSRLNKTTGLWSYVFPLYVVGAISSFLLSFLSTNPFMQDWSPKEILPVIMLALVPTLVGHSVSNWAMRYFHPQLVSIVNVTQFVWAAVMAFLLFGEQPGPLFYLAATIVLGGCAIAIVPGLPKRKSRDIKPEAAETGD